MANEFIARKGLIALEASQITGSLNVSGGITGSLFGTSSWAQNSLTASSADIFVIRTALTASGFNYPTAEGGEFSFLQSNGSGSLSFQYVNTLYETVYNGEATQLAKGTPVYISGSVGAESVAYRADASVPSKMPVVYVTADAIDPASSGRAIALGLITGVNTTGYPAGTEIYVGVSGSWTSARPTGSSIVQVLGYVTKEGAGGQGVILNPGPAGLPNLRSGSVWLGNSSSVPIAVSSASLFVNSASYALTSSFVNTLNQNLIITGAVSIGTSSIGPGENTLTLGARDNASEGGQLGLNAPGGTYTSASFLDVYQNRFRILRGTNVSSDAEHFSLNLHTGQLIFNKYLNTSSFAGTANAYLAIDTSGNVITTAGASVGSGDNLGNHTATQDLNLATFNIKNLGVITGSGNAQVSVGTYNFGYELLSSFPVTGSGLIVSSSALPANHYNMVKIGNVELIDLNSGITPNTFVIHNVDRLLIASGSEPVDIYTANNKLLDHNGTQFDIYGGGANYIARITSASSQFQNQGVFNALATKATAVNITHFAGWSSAPILPTADIVYMPTSSLVLPTSSINNFPTEVSRSAAAAGFGSGGGGGVTINNNISSYVVTATGTANTLDGEPSLTFDGTTLTVGGNAVITAIDTRNDPSTTIGEYAPGSHMARDWPAAGGPALTAGNIVYFSGSSQWANAEADITGSSIGVLGVVTNAADPNEILLQGTITINTNLATYQIGQPVYLSPSVPGAVTNVPPSTPGHVARYVGWVVDINRDQIYFNPDFTYIQI